MGGPHVGAGDSLRRKEHWSGSTPGTSSVAHCVNYIKCNTGSCGPPAVVSGPVLTSVADTTGQDAHAPVRLLISALGLPGS